MTTTFVRRAGVAGALLVAACARPSTAPTPAAAPIMREMRGVWVATVRNIDWPKDTVSADAQRAELIDLLDRAVANGFNAIVFQVRPEADALYRSAIEPWSIYMNGRQQGVDPGYDPLEFAIRESHARGLELHAWINPFRAARSASDTTRLAPTHAWNARRDLVRVYGDQLWLDPGEPDAREQTARVIQDLVRRYDLDGIHVDDYFYPYQVRDSVTRQIVDFPDSSSYARSGTTLPRDDWRRENIDRFVERMYRDAHEIKPAMKVGISPFGIWRPNYPAGACCFDAYAALYADARKWLREGWVDYFTPQLYWALSAPQQPFATIFDWWIGENVKNRHLWPGLANYRVGARNGLDTNEIARQIAVIRSRPGAPGHVMFNATTTLKRDNGVLPTLRPLFAQPALVPAFPWLDATAPAAPAVTVNGKAVSLSAAGETPRFWILHWYDGGGLFRRGRWTTRIAGGDATSLTLDRSPARLLVHAVDRAGNVGPAAVYAR